MIKTSFKLNSAYTLAMAIGLASSATHVNAKGLFLEEVLVTATKRAELASDLPMAITAHTGDYMKEMGVSDTTDIPALVPGLLYSDSAQGTPVYTLRGVGFNESSTQATATVGVYVDELAIPFPIMTRGPLLDIDRVEVLKGPQGTLYGRNSTGGAINYITSKATEEFKAGLTTSYGSYETLSVEGFVSGSLTDNVLGRLAVKTVQSGEGWQESISRDEKLGEQDKSAIRLSLTSNLSEDTYLLFSVNYWEDKSDSLAPQFIQGGYRQGPVGDILQQFEPAGGAIKDDSTKAEWTEGYTPAYDMDNLSYGLTIDHSLTDEVLFSSLTSVAEFNDHGSQFDRAGIAGIVVSDDTRPYMNAEIADLPDGAILTNDLNTVNSSIDSWSQEFRLTGESDDISWVAGIYYSESEVDNLQNQSFGLTTSTNGLFGGAAIGNFPGVDNLAHQETSTKAIFASADWDLSDKLTLTTGLRYTEDEADFVGCSADTGGGALSTLFTAIPALLTGIPGNAEPGGCATFILNEPTDPIGPSGEVKRSLDEDSLSWRLALDYQLNDDASVYFTYARGFKSGSFPTLAGSNSNQFNPVVQEQIDSYELGFKSSLAEGAARINGAIFYFDYQDKQLLTRISDPVFTRLFALNNVDESEVWGAEIDLQWMPAEGLTLGGAVSYMNTEIGDFVGTNQMGEQINFEGSEFPFSPNIQLNLTAKYEWNLSENLLGLVSLDVSYTGSSQADYESNDTFLVADDGTAVEGSSYQYNEVFDIDSYTLVNARIGVSSADGVWESYLWARNLSDEFYITNILQNSDMQSRYVGMPRTVGVTFEYNW